MLSMSLTGPAEQTQPWLYYIPRGHFHLTRRTKWGQCHLLPQTHQEDKSTASCYSLGRSHSEDTKISFYQVLSLSVTLIQCAVTTEKHHLHLKEPQTLNKPKFSLFCVELDLVAAGTTGRLPMLMRHVGREKQERHLLHKLLGGWD